MPICIQNIVETRIALSEWGDAYNLETKTTLQKLRNL